MEIDVEKMRKRLSKIEPGDPVKNRKIGRADTVLDYLDSNYKLAKKYREDIEKLEDKVDKLSEMADPREEEIFEIFKEIGSGAVNVR
jgi:predicted ribosome quality control (RQC) complex YloA/Tae2 family protein